jgi:hypothetical protein
MTRPTGDGERGQAALETVAMLPLFITIALAIGHLLAAETARELAGHAAEAAAIAIVHGGDPRDAAERALPEWSHDRIEVEVHGRDVAVRLEPLAAVPGVADLLATTARADAGPAAPAASSPSAGTAAETDRGAPGSPTEGAR